jgi:hypothetical protein
MVELGELDVRFVGTEANKLFLEPIFFDADTLNEFRVMGNVVNKKKIGFIRPLENIIRKYTGCGFNPVGSLSIYEREIEVNKMRIDLELCWDEFEDTVFEELLRTGTNIADVRDTQIGDILMNRARQGVKMDLSRLLYFGNKASADPNYDTIDGFWTVYYPGLVADGLIPRTNTGSGTAMASGDGIAILRAVYDQAPLPLKGLPNAEKVLNVTGSVWMQYNEDIEDGGGGDFGLMTLIEGSPRLFFRGIEVRPMWRWDEIATSLGTTLPNYVEYTTKMNKVLATDVLDPSSELRIWYDDKDEKNYVKARFKMGSNYIHPSLISVGY